MRKFFKAACILALLAAPLCGCSPATTFDGMSDGFNRLGAGVTRPAEPVEEPAIDSPGSIELTRLTYQRATAPELANREKINRLITKYASHYSVPERLVHRVVKRESTYNPSARNGIHLGLMQLNPQTARTMGFRGENSDLYDADTNLKYGVKYLRGALMVAKGNHDQADKLYQTGYYYHAKRMGLLQATGLRP